MKFTSVLLAAGSLLASTASAQFNNTTAAVTFPLSSDSDFSFLFAEILATASYGGASSGEVLRAAAQISPGNFESFYNEFGYLAKAVDAMAQSTKSPFAAREAYFRAANYYQKSGFFILHNVSDQRIYANWTTSLDVFAKAIALLPTPGEKISIKAKGFTVPAYFYAGQGKAPANGRRPTIIVGGGYDSSQEESYFQTCVEVTARGWNCVTYEGPGQPTVRRFQGLGFRPEWAEVTGPVIDYLETRKDVDCKKLGLVGLSFGAQLAVLSASVDPRVQALMLIDGLVDLQQVLIQQLPADLISLYKAGNETGFNQYLEAIYYSGLAPTSFLWLLDQSIFTFATTSYYKWFSQLPAYNITPYVKNLTMPVFIGGGDHDTQILNQAPLAAQLIEDAIGANATFHLFTSDTGAGEHCQLGAEAQLSMVMFDWVANVFGVKQY